MDDKRLLLLWVFLFAPLSKERSSPKRAELHPLPRFNRLYSTTSFRFSCSTSAVANGGGGCGVSTTKKQDGTKEGQTNSKCINNGGSEKLICKFASKSNLRWSSHPRMWRMEWTLCYESYSNSNWMPNYKIIAQSKQMPWKSLWADSWWLD